MPATKRKMRPAVLLMNREKPDRLNASPKFRMEILLKNRSTDLLPQKSAAQHRAKLQKQKLPSFG
jgi:hypothetical protein